MCDNMTNSSDVGVVPLLLMLIVVEIVVFVVRFAIGTVIK